MSDQIDVKILAQVGEFAASMREAQEQLGGIGEKIQSMTSLFTGFGEAAAAAFSVHEIADFAEKFADMGEYMNQTAAELGMSVSQVSALTTGLEAMGIDSQQATEGLERISRNIETAAMGSKTTAAAFEALGYKMSDIKHLTPNEVLERMADVFSKTQDGTQKTAIAMTLFGRTGAQLIPLLDKGREGLEEFRQTGLSTGEALSGQMTAGMEQTAESMHVLHMATQGVEITLFEALKPAIDATVHGVTDLVEWFNNSIKSGGELNSVLAVIVQSFDTVVAAVHVTVLGFRTLFEGISIAANAIGTSMLTLGKVIYDALTGHWGDIKADWGAGVSEIVDSATAKFNALVDTATETRASIDKLSSNLGGVEGLSVDTTGGPSKKANGAGAPKPNAPDMADHYHASAGAQKTRLSQWKQELQHKQDLEGTFHQMSKSQEADFWAEKLKLAKQGSKEYDQVFHEMMTARRAAAAQEMSISLSTLQTEMNAAKNNETAQKQLMATRVSMVKAAYGEDSRQYAAVMREKAQLDQVWEKKHEQLTLAIEKAGEEHSLRSISMALDHAKAMQQIGQMSEKQLLSIEKDLADQKYKIQEDYLKRKMQLQQQYGDDPKSIETTQASIAAIYDDHAKQLTAISDKAAKATQESWKKAFQPITQAFDTSVKGIVLGTTTMQKALANIWNSILSEFIDKMVVQQVNQWIAGEVQKTAATMTGTTERSAMEDSASSSSLATVGASILKAIEGYAAEAFAGVTAFLSPLVGPAAPAGGAAAQGAVLAVAASVPYASGAWNIPGTTPATLHAGETVLPAKAAQAFRSMASGKMPGGGDTHIHVHNHGNVYGLDDFRSTVVDAVKTGIRRGDLTPRPPGIRG